MPASQNAPAAAGRPTPTILGRRPRTALSARPVDPDAYRPPAQQLAAAAAFVTPPTVPAAGPFFVPRWLAAVQDCHMHPNVQRIAELLANRADPITGHIRTKDQLGGRAIAAFLGIGDTAAKTSLERLRRKGFIRRTPTPEGRPSRIELCMPHWLGDGQQPT